jgi:putative ABC transport system permease protein
MLKGRTPLGFLQLTHNKTRFAVACAGVGFAVVLVFMQLGFMNMLFDATVQIHKRFKADLVVMSSEAQGIIPDSGSFSRRRLLQASGLEGIEGWAEVYQASLGWTKPSTGEVGNIVVFGVPTNTQVFVDSELQAKLQLLKVPNSFLLDEGSRGDFSTFFARIKSGAKPTAKIANQTNTAVGTFRFGASFGTEAIAIVSSETFLSLTPQRQPGVINMGLLRVAPGVDPSKIVESISAAMGVSEVKVMTMADFIEVTRSLLRKNSPISTVFTFGVIVGLIVGAIIVIQILSSDVQDHLSEYATFKAMGFTNSYLLRIVYEQSAILTLFGFIPASLLSLMLYRIVGAAVSMDMVMTGSRIALVFSLTVVMCMLSGTVAMRRIFAADPAEVF